MKVDRKVANNGDVILTVDNKEYLKNAPEGFKEAVGYIISSNEDNKDKAVDLAKKEFDKDKKVSVVRARIPFGTGKNDNIELAFQRERTFVVDTKTGKKDTFAYVSQKPKSRLLGTNTHMKEVKERFKKVMAKA